MAEEGPILTYQDNPESPTLQFAAYDPRAPHVASAVSVLITDKLPTITVEHVGSTAVPGCDGKGVVDLMIAVEPEEREQVAETLLNLGFQRQTGGFLRPLMMQGAIDDGDLFKLHVHIVPSDAEDTFAVRRLRDILRADSSLRDEYVALKRSIIQGGVTDRVEYTRAKSRFIRRVTQQTTVR